MPSDFDLAWRILRKSSMHPGASVPVGRYRSYGMTQTEHDTKRDTGVNTCSRAQIFAIALSS